MHSRPYLYIGAVALSLAGAAPRLEPRVAAGRPAATPFVGRRDTLVVDLAQSVLRWKGTKFRGRGKHEGTVQLTGGALVLCHGRPCDGYFTIDMRTIAITDIPLSDPVPRERLARHLASEDFFWVERHPTATFRLRDARPAAPGDDARYTVLGDLALRGVTRDLAFPALLEPRDNGSPPRIRARFTIDRQRWGVEYRFDPVRNELIDDDIHLDLLLVLRWKGQPALAGRSAAP